MKTSLTILAIGLALCGGLQAQAQLPAEIIVQTEPTPAADFKMWVEQDPAAYNGKYAGDVGGDSGGSLEIKIEKGKADSYPPFKASGTFALQAVGSEAVTVVFKNASCDPEDGSYVNASAFRIFFVTLGNQKGVVVGDIFLPKK